MCVSGELNWRWPAMEIVDHDVSCPTLPFLNSNLNHQRVKKMRQPRFWLIEA